MFDENPSREIRDKRIAIAQDVLQQLEADQLDVRAACIFLQLPETIVATTGDFQTVLEQESPRCVVCALGACIVAKARLFDAVPMGTFTPRLVAGDVVLAIGRRDRAVELLQEIFSPSQALAIETAFECSDLAAMTAAVKVPTAHLSDAEIQAAKNFQPRYVPPRDRLRAIMNNIIEHDGVFRPRLVMAKVD